MKQLTPIKKLNTKKESKDLFYIMFGGAFLGSGGGGPLSMGEEIIFNISKYADEVNIVQAGDERIANKHGGVVCFMGSPATAKGRKLDLEVSSKAFNALSKNNAIDELRFTISIELGAANILVPILVSAMNKIPFVDGDGAGRAIPQLKNTLFAVSGKSSVSPSALANSATETAPLISTILNFDENTYPAEIMPDILESFSRQIIETKEFGNIGGLATYITKGSDLKDATITGTISLCYRIGEAVVKALDLRPKIDPMTFVIPILQEENRYFKIFKGKITDIIPLSGKGFDRGYVEIKNEHCNIMKIFYENENLYASLDSKIWAMAPDLICYMTDNGPVSNTEIVGDKKGINENVTIVGIAADNEFRRHKEIVNGFMTILRNNNIYDKEYIKIEDLE